MKHRCVLLIAFAFALESKADITNFLSNPGFESGDLTGWTVGGRNGGYGVATDGTPLPVTSAIPGFPDLFFASWQNVHSGNFGAYGITAGDSQEPFREYVSFSQRATLPSGTYQLGFYFGTDNVINGFGISEALSSQRLGIFLDGAYLPFLTPPPFNFIGGPSPSNFFQCITEVSVLDGTHDIEFRISGSGTGRAGISFDDAFLVAVPEPGTVSLVLVGSALLVIVRQKSHAQVA